MSSKQRHSMKKQSGAPMHRNASIVQTMLGTATQHHHAGRLAEAEKLYRQILAIDPRNADSLHLLGMINYQVGNKETAVDLIGQAIQINGKVCFYHSNLGNILTEQGRFDDAIVHYNKSLALKPDYAEAHNNLGHVLLKKQSNLDEAITHFNRALVLNPDYVDAYINLGLALKEQEKPDEVLACYEKALSLSPNNVKIHLNIGVVYQNMGKLKDAAAWYERALVINPDYADAHNNLGNTLNKLGMFDAAMAHYERAIAISPDADTHKNMGNVLMSRGDFESAIPHYEQSLVINPNNHEARHALAFVHFLKTPISEWNKLCFGFLQRQSLPNIHKHEFYVRLAIYYWVMGDFKALGETLLKCNEIASTVIGDSSNDFTNMRMFEWFITKLFNFQLSQPPAEQTEQKIAAIGDSHCLSFSNTTIYLDDVLYKISSHLILGCKAWHISKRKLNEYKLALDFIVALLPPQSKCFFFAGEIDCRFNEGILAHQRKHGGDIKETTNNTVKNYVKNIVAVMSERQIDVSFVGVPAPCVEGIRKIRNDFLPEYEENLVLVVHLFNEALKREATKYGCRYIDVYSLSAGTDGQSNKKHHIDNNHLNPNALAMALGSEEAPNKAFGT